MNIHKEKKPASVAALILAFDLLFSLNPIERGKDHERG